MIPQGFPWAREKPPCIHPSHNPPMHLHLRPGQVHVHRCPGCGDETTMVGSGATW
jgi:hypothetical protein